MKRCVFIKQLDLENIMLERNITPDALSKKLRITKVYLSNLKNEGLPNFRPSASLRSRMVSSINGFKQGPKIEFKDIFVTGDAPKRNPAKKAARKKTKTKQLS